MIPALLHMTLQNCKATLQHHKLTKSKLSIFYTSFCVYILMKTKPLDANMSSAHANTSSVHERGSRTPACQGSMGNTNDAMSSDPGTDEESQEGNSGQPSHKLLNLHFHSNFALLPYLQLQQKNIQLLLMTMKLRMKMEK